MTPLYRRYDHIACCCNSNACSLTGPVDSFNRHYLLLADNRGIPHGTARPVSRCQQLYRGRLFRRGDYITNSWSNYEEGQRVYIVNWSNPFELCTRTAAGELQTWGISIKICNRCNLLYWDAGAV